MADCLRLKKSNCKNCYKCIRNCPVKSIRFSENQAQIISNECVLCGHCVVVCPQHAKEIVNDVGLVKAMIRAGEKVIVSLAPSFIANYPGTGIEGMKKALLALGFSDVEETAIGATIVKREYERLVREEAQDVLITSCCHSVNLLIQKHFPDLLPYLADVLSPMQAHCQDIRRRHPEAKTVFIGPCLSKKDEAQTYPGIVDVALTFEELTEWLAEEGIALTQEVEENENSRARFFPTPGGVLKTLSEQSEKYTYMAVDGMENCIEVLNDVAGGQIHHCFIEMNACAGSCIGGPAIERDRRLPVQDYLAVAKYAGKKDFIVEQPEEDLLRKDFRPIDKRLHTPTETEIAAALKKMGKMSKQDELNCGCCGYNSCREKAIAICQGKAEISMCLPYLMERARSVSDSIFSNTPNGILVLNDDMEIQQLNTVALQLIGENSSHSVVGQPVYNYLDPEAFLEVQQSGKTLRNHILHLEEPERSLKMTVSYVADSHLTLGIIEDITEEEKEREHKEEMNRQTVEIADRVVEKQMRIVQEIASLLGETTAETKIALTKLKESIGDE